MSEMVRVQCPSCSAGFRVAAEHIGRSASCPTCKTRFVLGQAPAPIATASSVSGESSGFESSDPSDVFAAMASSEVTAVKRPVKATPQKPPSKARSFEWMGMALGGLVLVGAIVGLVMIVQSSGTPEAVSAAPTDPDKLAPVAASPAPVAAKPAAPAPTPSGPLYAVMGRNKLETEELFKLCAPSVAFVKGKHGSGTGFLLPGGIVCTNHHVVNGEFIEDVEIEFPGAKFGERGPFKPALLYEHGQRDIAFLQIEGCPLPPLEVEKSFQFVPGSKLVIIGNPGKGDGEVFKNSVAEGLLSTKDTVNNVDWLEFKGPVWHGNSGGPVFNTFGRVIGVVSMRNTQFQGQNWCIPPDEIETHFKQMNYRTDEEKKANGSRHRMAALATRLAGAASAYTSALNQFVELMRSAEKEALDEGEIGKKRNEFFEEVLKRIEKTLPENLEDILKTVDADATVPADAKDTFKKLLESFNATKTYFNEIKGIEKPSEEDHKKIKQKTRELAKAQGEILQNLGKSLDEIFTE